AETTNRAADKAPADWIDGHPQLEAIAAAVWERCEHHDSGLIIDDPRNIAVAALAAVLPAPADQTARLHDENLTLKAEIAKLRDLLAKENRRANDAIDREEIAEQAAEPEMEYVGGCTCAPGPERQHAGRCGWVPASPARPPADRAALLREAAEEERPLSPDYEHPECGFHWHGRDGMDIPIRDGQPVCPRCELAKVQKQLAYVQRMRDEVGEECKRRGRIKLEQA
ncbi:hypothetical protein, partial [Streptomyces sp. EN16]